MVTLLNFIGQFRIYLALVKFIFNSERVEMKYKENFGETIVGRIFEGSLKDLWWLVGGR